MILYLTYHIFYDIIKPDKGKDLYKHSIINGTRCQVREKEGTMNNYYIVNMETNKLELHFDKESYQALSDAEKSEIKSNFLFSRSGSCWVSRCKFPSLYRAEQVAQKIGLENAGKVGEHSFQAEMEARQARAEARAKRYDNYSDNAAARGAALQKPIEDMHGDIAFFTQPNINTSAGRAFTNRRNRMWASWEQGFEAFKKSEYFQEKAEAARRTAAGCKMQDVAFCERRIKEAQHDVNAMKKNIDRINKQLEQFEKGEPVLGYWGEAVQIDPESLNRSLEHYETIAEQAADKIAYYSAMIEAQGGYKFTKDNVNVGDVVKLTSHRWTVTVISKGKVNFTGRDDQTGMALNYQFAEIAEIVSHGEPEKIEHPFKVGDTFTVGRHGENIKVDVVKVAPGKVSIRENGGKAKSLKVRPAYKPGEYYFPVQIGYSWEWVIKQA